MDEENKPSLNLVKLDFTKKQGPETNADPDEILTEAVGKLETVMVVGFTPDKSFYLAVSQPSIAENLFILETTRLLLNEAMLENIE